MATVYKFKFYYKKAGVGTAPSSAPVCTVVNTDTDTKLADAQAMTALTNLAGYYEYEYTGADGLDCVALAHTTDATMDEQDLVSYTPERVTSYLDAAVSSRLAAAGYTAPDNASVTAILVDTGTTIPALLNGLATDEEIADAVRLEMDASSTKLANLDAAVTTRSTLTAQQVWEYVTRTITSGGVTPQEVWEYATRTLTAGAGISAADVWAYATRTLTATAAQTIATLLGNDITFTRGDTWSVTLTGLGNISAYVSLDFTVKTNSGKADSAATLRVRKNASAVGDGLLILNGAAGTPLQGTIAIDDAVAGDITITLAAAAAAQIEPRTKYYYDIQMITASTVQTLTSGELTVVADFTRAVS